MKTRSQQMPNLKTAKSPKLMLLRKTIRRMMQKLKTRKQETRSPRTKRREIRSQKMVKRKERRKRMERRKKAKRKKVKRKQQQSLQTPRQKCKKSLREMESVLRLKRQEPISVQNCLEIQIQTCSTIS